MTSRESLPSDGGPAFPREDYQTNGRQDKPLGQQGMSLRDYFAALAMHAELNTAGALEEPAKALAEEAENAGRSIEAQIAFNAYTLADAMLKERTNAR